MRIPTSFKLLGQTISVVYAPDIGQEEDCNGLAVYRKNEIRLQPSVAGQVRSDEQQGYTFCHELVHFIFNRAEYQYQSDKGLNDQEGLVGMCGSLLHQALDTMEYED